MMDGSEHGRLSASFSKAAGQTEKKTIRIDVERYQCMLDELDLSPIQKQEVLEALFILMVTFVDLGFSVAPLEETCGQLEEEPCGLAERAPGDVRSEDHEKEI